MIRNDGIIMITERLWHDESCLEFVEWLRPRCDPKLVSSRTYLDPEPGEVFYCISSYHAPLNNDKIMFVFNPTDLGLMILFKLTWIGV